MVDGAHAAIGTSAAPVPLRIFTPQVLGSDGGKPSKSLNATADAGDPYRSYTTCRGEECLTRVKRVGRYRTFKEMFGTEDVKAVNPNATAAEQLRAVQAIFPPHKEALGVLTFEIERVDADE
ncbi:hypothetical protein [Streptomyces sp. NPDC088775]|uniref:hypothetical protein n=1 Tax=Streptomyces sp. NPDC088775 TaxID=3365896 RepID=UPI0037F5083A